MSKSPDNPFEDVPQSDDDEPNERDILSRLHEKRPERPRSLFPPLEKEEPEPEEDFWAAFSMMTHTGERFVIRVCFRGKAHYNTQMSRLETAKNTHIVLKDVNDESVVIKREILLHVLPSGQDEIDDRRW